MLLQVNNWNIVGYAHIFFEEIQAALAHDKNEETVLKENGIELKELLGKGNFGKGVILLFLKIYSFYKCGKVFLKKKRWQ